MAREIIERSSEIYRLLDENIESEIDISDVDTDYEIISEHDKTNEYEAEDDDNVADINIESCVSSTYDSDTSNEDRSLDFLGKEKNKKQMVKKCACTKC